MAFSPRTTAGSTPPTVADGDTAAPASSVPQPVARRRRRPTRTSSLHVGLVAAAAVLVLLVVFLIQNAHTVQISFLGAHLRVSLAVAMLAATVAGALIVGAAGVARVAQLRHQLRHGAPAANR